MTKKRSDTKQPKNAGLPFQPIVLNANDTFRFRKNAVVRYLLDHGGLTLNDLVMQDFPQADWEQFYQLIGYSIVGFHELYEVSDATALRASEIVRKQYSLRDDYVVGCRDEGCVIHCDATKG